MNRCTLIIDGNWLLQSRSSRLIDKFSLNESEESREASKDLVKDMLAKSVSVALWRLSPVIDNIILVIDSKSWRKGITKPSSLQADYKGTRKKREDTDHARIFEAFHDMEKACAEYGVTVSNTWGAEGDDAIWRWSERLNAEGINAVVWSSDNDLRQLARRQETAWTVWYNDRAGIVADVKMSYKNDLDYFMRDSASVASEGIFRSLVEASGAKVTYEDPDIIVMEKIICGDKSDNIKSIVRARVGKLERKISPRMWESVRQKLGIRGMQDFMESHDRIIEECMGLKVMADTAMTVGDVREQLIYNTRLVWLNESQVPRDVTDRIDSLEYKVIDTESVKNNYKVLSGEKNTAVEDLFSF